MPAGLLLLDRCGSDAPGAVSGLTFEIAARPESGFETMGRLAVGSR